MNFCRTQPDDVVKTYILEELEKHSFGNLGRLPQWAEHPMRVEQSRGRAKTWYLEELFENTIEKCQSRVVPALVI